MYAVIAIHHPKPEYVDDFLAFMARVEAVAQGSRGMLQFRSWREENSNRPGTDAVNHVAIVTASGSRNGQETAKELAENGFDVGIT